MNRAEAVSAAGEALFGPHWVNQTARALNVNERQFRRWANGQDAVPTGVLHDLDKLLEERASDMAHIRERLFILANGGET